MKVDWGTLPHPPTPDPCAQAEHSTMPPGWLVLQEMNRGGCKLLTDVLRASNGHPCKTSSAHPWGKQQQSLFPQQKLEPSL